MTEVIDAEVVSDEATFVPDVSHLPYLKSRTGWCNDGKHGPDETTKGCPGITGGTPWKDPAGKGFIPNPARRCPCPCHARPLD